MQWTIVMKDEPTTQELLFDEDYVIQPGQGAIYFLSSETETEVTLLDKDGKPFPKQEKRIGFV